MKMEKMKFKAKVLNGSKFVIKSDTRNLKRAKARLLDKADIEFLKKKN